jgi:hypothetical protein
MMSDKDFQNQVGPNVQGQGTIFIDTKGKEAKILYAPQDPSRSTALYATNNRKPDQPLPVGEPLKIDNANNVGIDYSVQPGGDIKIAWSVK